MTNHAIPESHESNRCELMYVLCIRIFTFQSARSHPSHVACASEILLSWLDTTTLLDALTVKQSWLRDLRVITRNSVGHESLKVMSSDVALSVRARDAHERMSRPAPDTCSVRPSEMKLALKYNGSPWCRESWHDQSCRSAHVPAVSVRSCPILNRTYFQITKSSPERESVTHTMSLAPRYRGIWRNRLDEESVVTKFVREGRHEDLTVDRTL